MKARPLKARARFVRSLRASMKVCTAALLLAIFPAAGTGQAASPSPASPPAQTQTSPAAVNHSAPAEGGQSGSAMQPPGEDAEPAKVPGKSDRRRAAKLFLEASQLFEKQQFQQALHKYQQAATLDPSERNYALAVELARSHAVTALIQAAAKDRIRADAAAERAALEQALELDPKNIQVIEHLHELGDDAVRSQPSPIYEESTSSLGDAITLSPSSGVHSFHLHTDTHSAIQAVFKAYGLQATLDDSIRLTQVRLDMDDASFDQATQILKLLTTSFFVPLDAHRALVARDTPENRRQFGRLDLEIIYLPGLAATELTEVGTLAKTVFDLQQAAVDPSAGTITIRAPASTLNAFNSTIRELVDGRSQVLLQVDLIQLAHTSQLSTGVVPPQTVSAFNVYSEEQSILNANQSLVQEIIASGLAAPGDTTAILAILLASGQISSSLLTSGFVLFGGGLTLSALAPGPITANLNLNSSDSRELDSVQLRLGDGEAGTVKSGSRYPIQTASYSSGTASIPNIPGLTGAGASSSLQSLISSIPNYVPTIPQIQYQDLGLTLKATANVQRNNDVALNIDMKIDALAGSSINGNPILTNRAYSGIVTLRKGEGIVVVSDLDKAQSRAISGVAGFSEIPGMDNLTGKDTQGSFATLLIVITPHVIRGTQAAGHSQMMRIERTSAAR